MGIRIGLSGETGREGFAAVDALVALTLLALTISLALQGMTSARRLASRAVELRQAGALLQYLVDAGARDPGEQSGVLDPFQWRLEVKARPADPETPALRMCTRTAIVTHTPSRRQYRLVGLDFCAPRAGS